VFKRKRGSRPPMVAPSTMLEITKERMTVPMSALLQRQRAKHPCISSPSRKRPNLLQETKIYVTSATKRNIITFVNESLYVQYAKSTWWIDSGATVHVANSL